MGESACCNKANSTLDLRDRLGFPSSPRKEGAVLPSLGMSFRPVRPKRVKRVDHLEQSLFALDCPFSSHYSIFPKDYQLSVVKVKKEKEIEKSCPI
jgi:hypothetical protein